MADLVWLSAQTTGKTPGPSRTIPPAVLADVARAAQHVNGGHSCMAPASFRCPPLTCCAALATSACTDGGIVGEGPGIFA